MACIIGAFIGYATSDKDDASGNTFAGAMTGGCVAAGCLARLAIAALSILLILWLFRAIFW